MQEWHSEEGWGVLACPETSGGCWVHASRITGNGYRSLTPGQVVQVEWERARQDGYDYRAVQVGTAAVEDRTADGTDAYGSTLTIVMDGGPEQRSSGTGGGSSGEPG